MTFSPAVRAGDWVFLSGSAGIAKDGSVPEGIEAQAEQAFQNLGEVLEAAGCTWEQVVKLDCVLIDPMRDFQGWNKVFKRYFPANPPARTTVGTHELIGPDWLIEIGIIAVK
jgi:reactive intermediate/imine deaminase